MLMVVASDESEVPAHLRRRGNAQYQERRNEIVDLAATLFARQGYSATGIREIGEAAGLARGALYYYIESKESLLNEIHNRVLDPLLGRTQVAAASGGSASSRLRQVSEILMKEIVEHHDHVWVFLHEYHFLTGERRQSFRRKREAFEDAIIQLLDEGVEEGDFAPLDPRLTMLTFLGMHNYTYLWMHHEHRSDSLELSRTYCKIFFQGIARPGVVIGEEAPGVQATRKRRAPRVG